MTSSLTGQDKARSNGCHTSICNIAENEKHLQREQYVRIQKAQNMLGKNFSENEYLCLL